jgi:NADPH:quinone reductase-like Zn-dependent oxidoreductase
LDLVKSLGAGQVLDYTTTDSLPDGARFDLVLDAVGTWKSSALKKQCKKALTPGGRYISVDDGSPTARAEYLELLKEAVEAGQFKAVIDRSYPLEDMVEAHRYVDAGHKKGNVVLTVAHDD